VREAAGVNEEDVPGRSAASSLIFHLSERGHDDPFQSRHVDRIDLPTIYVSISE
jgi:hypothetical protein